MINNRQAGRRRGRGGGNNNGPRQGGQQGNGSRIDNRARGNASQLFEKYKNMAADAQRSGDRVNTEYYLQFADHYFRVLSEQRGRFDEQQPTRARRDEFDYEGDDDFAEEGEPIRAGEQAGDGRPRYDRQDRPERSDRPDRDEQRPREFRRDEGEPRRQPEGEVRRNGEGEPRRNAEGDSRRGGGESEPRRNGEGRRDWQDRDARRERRPEVQPAEVAGQHRADALLPGESLESRAEEVLDADRPLDAPAPRRRGRPRRETTEDVFEADRLPPAISPPATSTAPAVAANDEAPAEAKPRRRRARPAEDTPTAAE